MATAKTSDLLQIVKDASNYGQIHIIANKQHGKSNTKKVLASLAIRSLKQTKTVIIDTVGLWRFDFDSIPFYTIPKRALSIREQPIGIRSNGLPFYEKTYKIAPSVKREVNKLLEGKKPILFDLELESPLECGYFAGYILSYFYEKQRIKRKYHKGKLPDSYLIFLEEAENLFDSGFDRKMLSKIRKRLNESANMKIGIISSAQRETETNIKFRAKAYGYLFGRVSLTDYHSRHRSMFRDSKHKKALTTFKRGSFLYTPTDTIIRFPKFKPKGVPYEIKHGFIPQPQKKEQPKLTILSRIKGMYDLLFTAKPLNRKHYKKPFYRQKETETDTFDKEDDEYIEELETSNESDEFTPI